MTDEKTEKPHIWWSPICHHLSIAPFAGCEPFGRTVTRAQFVKFYTWRAGLESRGYVGWPHPGPGTQI